MEPRLNTRAELQQASIAEQLW